MDVHPKYRYRAESVDVQYRIEYSLPTLDTANYDVAFQRDSLILPQRRSTS